MGLVSELDRLAMFLDLAVAVAVAVAVVVVAVLGDKGEPVST